ncbi:hypothetical protein [Archangium lansingense]|uniref:Lipoprotein n=1 Tax=Archangium lansingense TaxID=2995310 RepID=A0ABT4A8D7_9BACT|nr:hypothetical protein [Archangium lansinium]MCY1077927.1 hypothetical protein [Archangium lansinium]
MIQTTKRFALACALLLGPALATAQSGKDNAPSPQKESRPKKKPPEIGEFTSKQTQFSGCGMSLWKPERSNLEGLYVFHNGTKPGSMRMMISGRILEFERIKGSGREFYGQYTSQTFRSKDGKVTAQVDLELGERFELELLIINGGTIRVTENGRETQLRAVGSAGC